MTEAESRQFDLLIAQARAAGQARLDEHKRIAGYIMEAIRDTKSQEVSDALVNLAHRILGRNLEQGEGR